MFRAMVAVAAIALSGCQQQTPPNYHDDLLLVQRLTGLESRITSTNERVERLSTAIYPDGTLRLSDSGWSLVNSTFGPLTIQLVSVTEEGAGSRVRLQIGNPTTATITELQLFGHWGALDKDGEPAGEAHPVRATIKSQLSPGSWNRASILIDGAKPDELGYLSVSSALVGSVTLTKPD
jgi:hypothetical protein